MDLYRIICPYCQCAHIPAALDGIYEEGYQAVVCMECGKPFVNQTTMTPVFVSYALVGVGQETPTPEEVEQDIAEDPEEILCVDCGKPAVPNSAFRLCAECAEDEPESQQLPISTNSVFMQCPLSKNVTCRFDGEYVDIKYGKSKPVRTTLADIYMLCEEENPTSTIKELLGERANTNNVAAVNAFVRAVKNGLIEVDA